MLDRTQGTPIRPASGNLAPGALPKIQLGAGTNPLPGTKATDRLAVGERNGATTELGELRDLMQELESRLQALEERLADQAPAPSVGPAPADEGDDWAVDGGVVPLGQALAEAQSVDLPLGDEGSIDKSVGAEDGLPPLSAQELADAEGAALGIEESLASLDGGLGAALATKQREYENRRTFIEDLGELVKGASLQGRTPAEAQAIARATSRLKDIAALVAKGEPVAQFAGEAFALKHRLADPTASGKAFQAANAGAQVYGMVAQRQDDIGARLDQLGAKQAAGKLASAEMKEAEALEAELIALDAIGGALGTAKLTGLSETGQKVALQAIDRLGALTEKVLAGGIGDPSEIEAEAHALGQSLATPNTPPQAAEVATGRDAVATIAQEQAAVRKKLAALDERLAGGALPESLFADRANLLAQAEALAALSQSLRTTKLDMRDPQARLIQEKTMQQAGALAEAMGRGVPASELWDDALVVQQTLADPFGSRNNAALQGLAALVGVAGKGARDVAQAQRGVQREVQGGADPRSLDGKLSAMNRAAEDLDGLRGRLSQVSLRGLTPAQEAEGARLAKEAQPFVQQMAQGKLSAKDARKLESLLQGLESLGQFAPGAKPQVPVPAPKPPQPAPKPPVVPVPAPQPQPQPQFTTYRTKKGDNLSKIAAEQMGDANRWREIVALNQDKYPQLASNPDLIFSGMDLKLPAGTGANPPNSNAPGSGLKPTKPEPKPVAPTPKPKPGVGVKPIPGEAVGPYFEYTVKPGDTLSKIAASQLGSAKRWREIVAANSAKHPELASNPNLLQVGAVLRIPKGGSSPISPPKPEPKPPVVIPTPPKPLPMPVLTTEKQAIAWLKANMGEDGRLAREEIEAKMPGGPGKASLLRHYDAFLFGKIDPGQPGWTDLHSGDIAFLDAELEAGRSLDQAAETLVAKAKREHRISDSNQDGRIDESDMAAFAAKMRAQGGTPPLSPPPKPTPLPSPAERARLQRELDVFLNDRNSRDGEAVKYLFAQAPGHVAAATPEQRSRLLNLITKGQVFNEERAMLGKLLDQADAKGELESSLKALGKKNLRQLFAALEDKQEGVALAGKLLKQDLYQDEAIWSAMDDEAARALGKHLGYREHSKVTNPQLQALPEAMKHHMIRELERGWSTWGERYLGEWINLHVAIPYRFPPPPGQESRS